MRAAVLAPIPGRASRSVAEAVLMLMTLATAGLAVERARLASCAVAGTDCAARKTVRAATESHIRNMQSSLKEDPEMAGTCDAGRSGPAGWSQAVFRVAWTMGKVETTAERRLRRRK